MDWYSWQRAAHNQSQITFEYALRAHGASWIVSGRDHRDMLVQILPIGPLLDSVFSHEAKFDDDGDDMAPEVPRVMGAQGDWLQEKLLTKKWTKSKTDGPSWSLSCNQILIKWNSTLSFSLFRAYARWFTINKEALELISGVLVKPFNFIMYFWSSSTSFASTFNPFEVAK